MTAKTKYRRRKIKMPMEKRYVKRCLISIAASVGAAIVYSKRADDAAAAISLLTKDVFIPTGSMAPVSTVIYTCFGSLVFCYLFSDFFEEGVSYSAIHVLSRSTSRFGWFAKRLSSMALYALLYVAVVDALMAVVGGVPVSLHGAAFLGSVALLDALTLM